MMRRPNSTRPPPARPRPPQVPALPLDSLAFALLQAAQLVAAVRAGRNLNDALDTLWRSRDDWTPGQKGAIQDMAYSSLRHFGHGHERLASLLTKPAVEPIHSLLLVAAHRLRMVPQAAHTIVDQAVRATEQIAPGLKALVNGVLRNLLRHSDWKPRTAEGQHDHPQWWIKHLQDSLPQDWQQALAAGNQPPPMTLRVNQRLHTPQQALAILQNAGLPARPIAPGALCLERPVPVSQLPGFDQGWFSVQDAGAQWAAPWLDLHPGQRVLDACAAPGGKAAQILETCNVALLALELDGRRAERIRENFQRLGLQGHIQVADCIQLADWWDGRPFHRILADVPCSASGVVRRHPDIKWLRRPEDIPRFAAQQREILDALWRTLAPGGKMLYVTCSVFPEENQQQIAGFLAHHHDATIQPIDDRPDQQLIPHADNDGFYYALLQKNV